MKKSIPKSFYVYCDTHCPRRSLEASKTYKYFIANGLRPVANPKKADLIFIQTCGGFTPDEEFSILTIKKSLENKSAKVVATGCLTKINPETLMNFDNLLIIPSGEYEILDSLINAKIPYGQIPNVSSIAGVHHLHQGNLFNRIKKFYGRTRQYATLNVSSLRAYCIYVKDELLHSYGTSVFSSNTYKIEIAEGCLGNCSYCAIKLAMPRFHSYSEGEILERFKAGLKIGYKDFALCAGDIGCYGLDINTTLPNLLQRLFEVEGDYRILLNDMNAVWLVKYYAEFLKILKNNHMKISRIVVPIQSGSNRILKLMNRNYKIEEIAGCIKGLHKAFPKIMIETHIVVGFPGETDSDFQKTLQVVKDLRFSRIVLYPYDQRPHTIASILPDKIAQPIINQRMRELSRYAFG